MWAKLKHTVVVLRLRITSDIEPREPEILGGREGETEPGRHANSDGTIIRLMRVRPFATAISLQGALLRGPPGRLTSYV